ncbi:MAG TPA: hypothetical protein VM368_07440 [Flavisolibacter sp.]|nr:hypothetical protein [Flavisolibacter sp.]
MVFNIIVKPIVFLDIDEAIDYYEKKLKGLGYRFYQSVLHSLDEIQSAPFSFSYIKKPIRRHLIKNYPYRIYYIISKEQIIIIGVSHAKRSNAFVKRRLNVIK